MLGLACFQIPHPLVRRLGVVALLGVTFSGVYFLTENFFLAGLTVLLWLFLPWIELLTKVRKIRLPMDRALRQQAPPSEDVFPDLEQLTDELVALGFTQADDIGWRSEEIRQHFRLFHEKNGHTLAVLTLTEQSGLALGWLSFKTRGTDGSIWTTWNYPFSDAMHVAPRVRINREKTDLTAPSLLESHGRFLIEHKVIEEAIVKLDPEDLPPLIAAEMDQQIEYNLSKGILEKTSPDQVRYTWRGLCFIWMQFLLDLVRIR